MTVRHLQSVQRQQLAVAVATDPAVLGKFRTGFSECAGEVGRYLGRMSGVEPAVRQRLSNHLAQCLAGLQQLDPNNNPSRSSGMSFVPQRLPTGELALLVPLMVQPQQPQVAGIDRSHPSAFTAVRPQATSPLPSPTSTISEDDSLVNEPYPSPSTPPNLSSQFKQPYRPFQVAPEQQPHVTSSTSDGSSTNPNKVSVSVGTVTELNVEFKTIPLTTSPFPVITRAGPTIPTHQPLTVITSQEKQQIYITNKMSPVSKLTNHPFASKDVLDYSVKREEYPQLQLSIPSHTTTSGSKRPYSVIEHRNIVDSSSLLMVQPPSKISRISYQTEEFNSEHSFKTQVDKPQDTSSKASTSSSASASTSAGKDMWRPW